jgi:hypothetical protein
MISLLTITSSDSCDCIRFPLQWFKQKCLYCFFQMPFSTKFDSSTTGVIQTPSNFRCSMCGISFSSQHMLQGHMSWHTGVKFFKCELCGEAFRYNSGLKTHVWRMHHETYLWCYLDVVCGKFTGKGSVNLMQRSINMCNFIVWLL